MKKTGFRILATLVLLVLLVPTTLQADKIYRNQLLKDYAPVCRVNTSSRDIALTFDDGPDPVFTPKILALLNSTNSKATFFVIGTHAAANPQLITSIRAQGSEVANHTWNHTPLPELSTDQTRAAIKRTNAVLDSGPTATLFRAPFGYINRSQLIAVRSMGLTPLHWSEAPDHLTAGENFTAQQTATALIKSARPGQIILAHDAPGQGRNTVLAALQIAIPKLKAQGYTFTDASTLLANGTPVLATPRFWFWEKGYTCS